jgi:hypothetical protein
MGQRPEERVGQERARKPLAEKASDRGLESSQLACEVHSRAVLRPSWDTWPTEKAISRRVFWRPGAGRPPTGPRVLCGPSALDGSPPATSRVTCGRRCGVPRRLATSPLRWLAREVARPGRLLSRWPPGE